MMPRHPATLHQRPQRLTELPQPCEVVHIVHRISAGFPSPAADYVEEGFDPNEYLIHNKRSTFVFTVRGASMSGAGIVEGDKVIVDRSVESRHGDIVVAVVAGEYTIKRFCRRGSCVELHPENPAYPVITFSEDSELMIWGVVVGVARSYCR